MSCWVRRSQPLSTLRGREWRKRASTTTAMAGMPNGVHVRLLQWSLRAIMSLHTRVR